MPGWVITLISVAASAVVSTIVGFLIKRSLDRYFAKKDKEAAEKEAKLERAEQLLEEKKQKTLEDTMNRIVQAHTDPIDQELSEIRDKLDKVAAGTLDTLRDRILSSYYKCLEKGFRTQYDIDNVKHMYDDYTDLHGNTFVKECMDKFKNIPTEEEYKIKQRRTRKPRAKKQVLLENK